MAIEVWSYAKYAIAATNVGGTVTRATCARENHGARAAGSARSTKTIARAAANATGTYALDAASAQGVPGTAMGAASARKFAGV